MSPLACTCRHANTTCLGLSGVGGWGGGGMQGRGVLWVDPDRIGRMAGALCHAFYGINTKMHVQSILYAKMREHSVLVWLAKGVSLVYFFPCVVQRLEEEIRSLSPAVLACRWSIACLGQINCRAMIVFQSWKWGRVWYILYARTCAHTYVGMPVTCRLCPSASASVSTGVPDIQ